VRRTRTAADRYWSIGAPSLDRELVIPAKNEARNLATVLENLPDCVDEVILVDGRSST